MATASEQVRNNSWDLVSERSLIKDQYADGKAANIWELFIGDQKSRTANYKSFLLNLLKKHGCKRILDVACGTGVDSIWLLEEGFDVTSIDASDKMLKHAYKTRWDRRKESAFDQWEIREANWLTLWDDMVDIVGNGYDAVICLGNSFAHLLDNFGDQREQKQAIQNFERCLKSGGLLIIDHRNYDNILNSGAIPPRSIYYNSKYAMDISTSVLYASGQPVTVMLDYTIDTSKHNIKYTNKEPVTNFRLFYHPHKLEVFKQMLIEIFGRESIHKIFGDFQALGEIENPGFYIHVIEKEFSKHPYRNHMDALEFLEYY